MSGLSKTRIQSRLWQARLSLTVMLVSLCNTVLAAAPHADSAAAPSHGDYLASVIQVFGGLAIIIAVIFAAAWGWRRVGSINMPRSSNLRVLSVLSMGQKERVALIECEGTRILVGVSPAGVQPLMVLDGAMRDEHAGQSADKERVGAFAEKLTLLMGKKG